MSLFSLDNVKYNKDLLFESLKQNCGLYLPQYYSPHFLLIKDDDTIIDENTVLSSDKNIISINSKIHQLDESDIIQIKDGYYNVKKKSYLFNNTVMKVLFSDNNEGQIFCKVSPLINPLKIITEEINLDKLNFPTNIPKKLSKDIYDINNFAYVECFILFCLSKLSKWCPGYPKFYGCINGVVDNYYFNFTEYLDELEGSDIFYELKTKFKLLYHDINASSVKSLNDSLKSTDLLSSINDLSRKIKLDFDNILHATVDFSANNKSNDDSNNSDNDDSNNGDNDDDDKKYKKMKSSNPLFDLCEVIDKDTNFNNTTSFDIFSKMTYLLLNNYPVNYCFIEKVDITLNDYILSLSDGLIDENWYAFLFQIAYLLLVGNKALMFVHSDIHGCNIMLNKTDKEYLYYKIDDKYYKVPTYGYILKIIDFGRSCIKFNDRWIISNHYKKNGEAYSIYTYPNKHGKYTKNIKSIMKKVYKPHCGVDLVRLFTTMVEYLTNNNKNVHQFIYEWSYDDNKKVNMMDEDTDFDIYVKISHTCHNTTPYNFLTQSNYFTNYVIDYETIKDNYVYNYNDVPVYFKD
jgi:hypothetical protein